MARTRPKQVHLAAHFSNVSGAAVWRIPEAGSQIAFESFAEMAREAERGKFDYLFLAEALRLRERNGKLCEHEATGRLQILPLLCAVGAVTEHLGLVATISTTFNHPVELARQLASADQLTGGRIGWNVVTTASTASFVKENFEGVRIVDHAARYRQAAEFLQICRELWESWSEDEVIADVATGRYSRSDRPGVFRHRGTFYNLEGHFSVPRTPQVHPVIMQAGDSHQGREFAAATADVVFTVHGTLEAGQAFYADMKSRTVRYGRDPDDVKVMPSLGFILGDTEDEARERARHLRRQQVSPATARFLMEDVWQCDLSDVDPDGPLPSFDPVTTRTFADGGAMRGGDNVEIARQWRARAEAEGKSMHELAIEVAGYALPEFVGTPDQIAAQIDLFVQQDAVDGFIVSPWIVPGGLREFVDKVVPLLQERGVYPTEYEGATLRENLDVAAIRPAAVHAAALATATAG